MTTLDITEEIPPDEVYINKLIALIETITDLKESEFTLFEDENRIVEKKVNNYLFLVLPNRALADKVFNSQPLFGCLLVHKLSHNKICPFVRSNSENCLVCEAKKDKECVLDLCGDCCRVQRFKPVKCSCGGEGLKVEEEVGGKCEGCGKSERDGKCGNSMCEKCCVTQAQRNSCFIHEEPVFFRNLPKGYAFF